MDRQGSSRAAVAALFGTVTLALLATTKDGTAVIPGWVTIGLIPVIWLIYAWWFVRDRHASGYARCQNCGAKKSKDELELIDGAGPGGTPWIICASGCKDKIK